VEVKEGDEDGDDADTSSVDCAKKMALRQWTRQAQVLSAALEKIVAIAQDDGELSNDVAQQYTMACTAFALIPSLFHEAGIT